MQPVSCPPQHPLFFFLSLITFSLLLFIDRSDLWRKKQSLHPSPCHYKQDSTSTDQWVTDGSTPPPPLPPLLPGNRGQLQSASPHASGSGTQWPHWSTKCHLRAVVSAESLWNTQVIKRLAPDCERNKGEEKRWRQERNRTSDVQDNMNAFVGVMQTIFPACKGVEEKQTGKHKILYLQG